MIVPMYEQRGETIWRVARKTWTNSLTISNVLAGVPDHKLIVEELNAENNFNSVLYKTQRWVY